MDDGTTPGPAGRPGYPRVLLRKAIRFLRQPPFVQGWFLPLWFLLGLAKLAIRLLSFRRLAPRLGRHAGKGVWVPLLEPAQERRALLIGRAVRLAARYTPWESNCFPQAVAARLLLGLYGIPCLLCFGMMRDRQSGEMMAHAWVTAGRVGVTGGPSFSRYTVVGCFVAPRRLGGEIG